MYLSGSIIQGFNNANTKPAIRQDSEPVPSNSNPHNPFPLRSIPCLLSLSYMPSPSHPPRFPLLLILGGLYKSLISWEYTILNYLLTLPFSEPNIFQTFLTHVLPSKKSWFKTTQHKWKTDLCTLWCIFYILSLRKLCLYGLCRGSYSIFNIKYNFIYFPTVMVKV